MLVAVVALGDLPGHGHQPAVLRDVARRGFGAGVQLRGLHGAGRRDLGVDHRELQVRRSGQVGGHLDLDLVHLADEELVGARTSGRRLGAARVGAVLGVVGDRHPVRPRGVVLHPHLHADGAVGVVLTAGPGDADGAVAGDRLRGADHGARAAGGDGGPGAQAAARDLGTGGRGEGVLLHRRVERLVRHQRLLPRGTGVRGERGRHRGGLGCARATGHHVERDDVGGGGQCSQDQAECQQLLTHRDEPRSVRGAVGGILRHVGATPGVGEESHA